jgi:hypothetical protein
MSMKATGIDISASVALRTKIVNNMMHPLLLNDPYTFLEQSERGE